MSSSPSSRRRWPLALLGLLVVGAAVAAYFVWFRPKPPPSVDMSAVLAANTRGVGKMEQFEFPAAVPEFEEVTRLAPDWLPGHVNLAIALLNQDKPEPLDRA